uniref:Uncharacterized protein n=1 Tax=Oncorhynchus kisutch TaxID=8019 RepID=A0A8C7MSL2_ONCKI
MLWVFIVVSASCYGYLLWWQHHVMGIYCGGSIMLWVFIVVAASCYGYLLWWQHHVRDIYCGGSIMLWHHVMGIYCGGSIMLWVFIVVSVSCYGYLLWRQHHVMGIYCGGSIMLWVFIVAHHVMGIYCGGSIMLWVFIVAAASCYGYLLWRQHHVMGMLFTDRDWGVYSPKECALSQQTFFLLKLLTRSKRRSIEHECPFCWYFFVFVKRGM